MGVSLPTPLEAEAVSRGPAPASEPIRLLARDGIPLGGRVWPPSGRAEVTALMLPGVGIPQRTFRHLAGWLAERGVRCLTLDYRGIGESRLTREASETAGLTTWARLDAVAGLGLAESLWREPVVLVGHSFGGQALGLARELGRVRAAVLIGSQLGQRRHWDRRHRVQLLLYWHLVLPLAAALFDPVPAWVAFGTRLPSRVARQWAAWGRAPEWFLSTEREADELLGRLARPVLAYSIQDDPIAPPRAVSALLERLRSAEVTRRDIHPRELGLGRIGHVGLLRPGATAPVWEELLAFLRRHAG